MEPRIHASAHDCPTRGEQEWPHNWASPHNTSNNITRTHAYNITYHTSSKCEINSMPALLRCDRAAQHSVDVSGRVVAVALPCQPRGPGQLHSHSTARAAASAGAAHHEHFRAVGPLLLRHLLLQQRRRRGRGTVCHVVPCTPAQVQHRCTLAQHDGRQGLLDVGLYANFQCFYNSTCGGQTHQLL